jgi:hypothetical protein
LDGKGLCLSVEEKRSSIDSVLIGIGLFAVVYIVVALFVAIPWLIVIPIGLVVLAAIVGLLNNLGIRI